jgi:hypothetical protein
MVGHQDIRMDSAARCPSLRDQQAQVQGLVGRFEEARRAIVTALNDVSGLADDESARGAGHG